jgi:hypothetical protein
VAVAVARTALVKVAVVLAAAVLAVVTAAMLEMEAPTRAAVAAAQGQYQPPIKVLVALVVLFFVG